MVLNYYLNLELTLCYSLKQSFYSAWSSLGSLLRWLSLETPVTILANLVTLSTMPLTIVRTSRRQVVPVVPIICMRLRYPHLPVQLNLKANGAYSALIASILS